jgi:Asp-tRNA(Asn)/Glu-tRNA(Gln) amidotransferase A subunit family amidase
VSALRDEIDRLEERFERREPELLSFLPEEGRFERLRRQAEDLEARWPDPKRRPPLFGLPVGIKDIFHVEGFPTRAGSRLPPEVLRGEEGPAVAALKAAGALIAGKTVSTEFAYFAPGPTRNPYHPEHTPGGSSSGSAAAVGAGLVPLALGTQTIGSITRPAAFCNAVGLKPSYDRVSRDGVIPLAPPVDHIGAFTPDVATMIRAARVLLPDWRDDEAQEQVGRFPVLGIPEGPYLSQPGAEGQAHFLTTCDRLRAAGFEVRAVPALLDFDAIVARHRRLVAAEVARVHAEWFPRFRELYAPQTIELIERGQKVSEDELEQDRTGRAALRAELTAAMERHGIDLWISPPARGPAPCGLASTGDPIMNLPWSHAGLPTLGLPAGRSAEGLPMGLQLAGGWWRDEALLAWGEEIERAARP